MVLEIGDASFVYVLMLVLCKFQRSWSNFLNDGGDDGYGIDQGQSNLKLGRIM